jgi:hypothetical protein
LEFGLKAKQDISAISASLTLSFPRCGFTVPFWLTYQNQGTITASGQIKFVPDDKSIFISSNPAVSSINGDTLIWDFTDLNATIQGQIELAIEMPGVDAIGDSVSFAYWVEYEDKVFHGIVTSEILCAYDPNDKTATPFGVGEEYLTLKNEPIEYRIRFQNMGNFFAQDIVIRDTLQADFDLSTFKVISSSFPVRTQVENGTRAIAFYFDNINLPDSARDEPNSHGFVNFRITPKAGLPEETVVENTAHIYFDFNPVIVTNTTMNTLVTSLPVDKVNGIKLEDISSQVSLFPNPADGSEIILNFQNQQGEKQITIMDLSGRVIFTESRIGSNLKIDISGLNSGLYLVEMRSGETRAVKKLVRQ